MEARFTKDVVQLLEHIPNAFYALDKKMNFIYANKRIQTLLKKDHAEIHGRNIWELFPLWMNSPLHDKLSESLQTGNITHLEEYYSPLHMWFEMYCYPSRYGLAVFVNDITERKTAETYLDVLNKAGEMLAITHDLDEALDKLCKMIVPEHADWFTIDLLEGEKVELLKLEHPDKEKTAWAVEYRKRTTLDINQPKPGSVAWVTRLGIPVLLTDVTDEMMRTAASDDEHLTVLRMLDIKSAMIVPMPFRGKNIGAVTFLSSRAGKHYADKDLSFAKDLAIRIGTSIDHARVSEEARKATAFRIQPEGLKLSAEAKERIRSSGIADAHTSDQDSIQAEP